MSIENSPKETLPNPAQIDFQRGQQAFEAGEYRQSVQALERSLAMAPAGSVLQGDTQVWLVMAYEAAGDRIKARQLCNASVRHPQVATRKSAKALLCILEAPELKRRDDWVTKIPNLENIPSRNEKAWAAPAPTKIRSAPPKAKPKGYTIPEPTDPTKVETEDRGFVWLALIGSTIVVLGLIWLA